jgi:hypothetical protein
MHLLTTFFINIFTIYILVCIHLVTFSIYIFFLTKLNYSYFDEQ